MKRKKKSSKSWNRSQYVIPRLWRYLYNYKGWLVIALILAVTSNFFSLIGPFLSGRAIDAISLGPGKVDFDRVFLNAAWMVVFYILSSALSYVLSIIMLYISQGTVEKMRKDLFEKLLELPVGYYDTQQAGDIVSKFSYDIDVINSSLTSDLVQVCASIVTVIGSFIMMLAISPTLVLVMVVMIPVSIGYTKYMTGKTKPLFRKRSAMLGKLNGFVEEKVSGQKTIRAYAREEVMLERFSIINNEALDAYYNADYYGSIVGPTVNFINNLSLTLVTTFGAVLYLFGRLTLGNISAFVLYSRKFSGPINEVANIISELQSAFSAAERVFKVLDEEVEVADGTDARDIHEVEGNVEIRDVSFGYEENQCILKKMNLKADKGSLVAIVGPTGAGKTTIINLLMRFYEVEEGEILLDGRNIKELTRAGLRRTYAMVLQDTWLFQGTIYENIAYGKLDATKEDVIEVAKAANIHSFIKRLPKGYDTILNEEGMNISKGQKQLLTIARAMLLEAKMLILDEATSNVDTRTEIQIQKAMRRLMADKTCFVIAHRLSTIQNADQILVIDQGNVVEQGKHDELMSRRGFYYQLYASQFL